MNNPTSSIRNSKIFKSPIHEIYLPIFFKSNNKIKLVIVDKVHTYPCAIQVYILVGCRNGFLINDTNEIEMIKFQLMEAMEKNC